FGMPAPEGYRKALRLMEMAERFNMPIITFIDTPGAYPGVGAEAQVVAAIEDEHKADAVFIDFGYGTGIHSVGKSWGRKWQLVSF
ncbi:hypothetical protein MJI37_34745, partial [Salmonella enterica subsp. enterica serovar Cerro]|nr:hypothetical protein [Salmonella enterica subsp. enterica serovar Cerro]